MDKTVVVKQAHKEDEVDLFINLSNVTHAYYVCGPNKFNSESTLTLHFGAYRLDFEGESAEFIYEKLNPALKKKPSFRGIKAD